MPPGSASDRSGSPERHAYRVETGRLTVRCYEPADAEALRAAVASSSEHLLPWLPWAAAEPQSLDQKIELTRHFRGNFDLGRDFVYAILERDGGGLVGGTGLHPRCGPGGMEIGYWIRVDRTGRGYATEASSALVRVAFELLQLEFVEINCDPRNVASAAVPAKLGFRQEGLLRARLRWPEGERRDKQVWTLLAADYAASPCAAAIVEAYDVVGRRLL